jgi:hypothetical protein
LWIFDSGWGGVQMVVELAKQGIAAIVHIKNNFAGYPVTELGDKLRNCPVLPCALTLKSFVMLNGTSRSWVETKNKLQLKVRRPLAGFTYY